MNLLGSIDQEALEAFAQARPEYFKDGEFSPEMVAQKISSDYAQNQPAQVMLWMDLMLHLGIENVQSIANSKPFILQSMKIFNAHGNMRLKELEDRFINPGSFTAKVYDYFKGGASTTTLTLQELEIGNSLCSKFREVTGNDPADDKEVFIKFLTIARIDNVFITKAFNVLTESRLEFGDYAVSQKRLTNASSMVDITEVSDCARALLDFSQTYFKQLHAVMSVYSSIAENPTLEALEPHVSQLRHWVKYIELIRSASSLKNNFRVPDLLEPILLETFHLMAGKLGILQSDTPFEDLLIPQNAGIILEAIGTILDVYSLSYNMLPDIDYLAALMNP